MRKADLLILLTLLGVTASLWHSRLPPTPTPTPARGEITLAGLSLGMTRTEIEKRLGTTPKSNGLTHTLRYTSDGAELILHLEQGQLTSIQGTGRWMLQRGGLPLPAFGAKDDRVQTVLGKPYQLLAGETYGFRYKWYESDTELLLQFGRDHRVSSVILKRTDQALPESQGGKH